MANLPLELGTQAGSLIEPEARTRGNRGGLELAKRAVRLHDCAEPKEVMEMGIEENKKFALEFIEAISRGDAQAIQDAYAEDGSSWTIGTMPISGRFSKAEIAQTSSAVLDVFPDGLAFEVLSMTAEGDRVAIEAESKGVHISGKTYNNLYHFLMRVRDGKIVEWKEYMDTMHANDVLCGGA